MGSLLLFVLIFFVLIIAIPIISIIRVVMSVAKGPAKQQSAQQDPDMQLNKQSASPINRRFDKSKAEDVEFEEV